MFFSSLERREGKSKVMIYLLTSFVIQSEAMNLENILVNVFVYVTEILPPFGSLNDKIVSRSISFQS